MLTVLLTLHLTLSIPLCIQTYTNNTTYFVRHNCYYYNLKHNMLRSGRSLSGIYITQKLKIQGKNLFFFARSHKGCKIWHTTKNYKSIVIHILHPL
jgi:hypothetical protein